MASRSADIPWDTSDEIRHSSESGSPFDVTRSKVILIVCPHRQFLYCSIKILEHMIDAHKQKFPKVGAEQNVRQMQVDESAFSFHGKPRTAVSPKKYVKSGSSIYYAYNTIFHNCPCPPRSVVLGDLYKNLYPKAKKPDTAHSARIKMKRTARKERANPPNTKFRL